MPAEEQQLLLRLHLFRDYPVRPRLWLREMTLWTMTASLLSIAMSRT